MIQSADPDGEAYRAGLRPADIVHQAFVGDGVHPADHPLQVGEWEFRAACGAPVTLDVERNSEHLKITLNTMDWQVVAGPVEPGVMMATEQGPITQRQALQGWATIESLRASSDEQALVELGTQLQNSSELELRWRAELLVLTGVSLHRLSNDQSRSILAHAANLLQAVAPKRALDLRLQIQAQQGLRRPLVQLRTSLAEMKTAAAELSACQVIEARLAHLDGLYTSVGGDLKNGAAKFDRAREIYSRIAPHHPLHAQMHNNLGINARRLGDYDLALSHYQMAEAIATGNTLREQLLRAQILNNQGVVARNQGDLVSAENAFRQSHEVRQSLDLSPRERISPLGNRVNVALDRLELDKALRLQRELIDLLSDIPNTEYHGSAWHGLGSIYLEREQPVLALEAFENAMAAYNALAPAAHRIAPVILGMGRSLAQMNDHTGAIAQVDEGLAQLNEAIPNGIYVARAHLALAQSQAALARWAEAALSFTEAAARFSVISPHNSELALAYFGLARSRVALAEPDGARQAFEQAIETIEAQMLVLGGSRATLARYRSRFDSIYKTYAQFLLDQLGTDEAGAQAMAALMERYRTQRAVRQLQSRELNWQDYLSDSLAAELQQFQPRFDSALRRLERSAGKVEAASKARDQVRLLREQRDELLTRVRAEAPRAANIRFPRQPALARIAGELPPDYALVSYLVLQDRIVAVVTRHGGSTLTAIEHDETQLTGLSERWLNRIALGQPVNDDSSLYQLLIGPLLPHLSTVKRLVFLTDGPLNNLPFSALWDGDAYLVERFTVAYADGLSGWQQTHPEGADGQSLIVAEPIGEVAEQLPPLPFAAQEARWISPLLSPATLWRGPQASEQQLDGLHGKWRVLHFATHASINPVWPMESYLVLSSDEIHNGKLQAWEVFNRLRFDARLVTLSGCATDAGVPQGGEGLLGFTQAFRYAGARNVLASLWAVGDRSTAVLMQQFYQGLSNGDTLDQALAGAQRALITAPVKIDGQSLWQRLRGQNTMDARAPLHWAAFRLNRGEMPLAPSVRSNPMAAAQTGPN